MFAQAGFDVATEFALEFIQHRVKGQDNYLPVLASPQAESTGGGKQVVQHLNLKPSNPWSGCPVVRGMSAAVMPMRRVPCEKAGVAVAAMRCR